MVWTFFPFYANKFFPVIMPPMDASDVYYDAFLLNGHRSIYFDELPPGETVRLRVINGSAATYFNLQYAEGPLKLISADGVDVEPVTVKKIPIAVAETYDFLLIVPHGVACEFRATAQDGSGFASAFIGKGNKIAAPDIPPPNPFDMSSLMGMDHASRTSSGHDAQAMHMGHHGAMPHQMGKMETDPFSYSMLRAKESTRLPDECPLRKVVLELNGNMERYVWTFNNIPLSKADKILIRRGEKERVKLVNKTMMGHPMHLHGHFFRLLNGQGDFAPLKHTVDVPPMATTEFEFAANEDKDWFFHCHILYHMAGGMARVFHYEGSVIDSALEDAKKKSRIKMHDDDFFFWGDASVMSHMHEGELLLSNTWNGFGLEWDGDWHGEYEISPHYSRYVGPFLSFFAGAELSKEDEKDEIGFVGMHYVLPFSIESELRFDTDDECRLQFGSEIQLLPRLFFEWMINTDSEWRYGMEWVVSKSLSLVGNIDSDYDAGIGLRLRF